MKPGEETPTWNAARMQGAFARTGCARSLGAAIFSYVPLPGAGVQQRLP
ncbi:MAG: hypothetical protein ACLGQX_15790 [Acidobacteriota bacterium]